MLGHAKRLQRDPACRREALHRVPRAVGRRVIDDDDLVVLDPLQPFEGGDQATEQVGAVVRRNHDRSDRCLHGADCDSTTVVRPEEPGDRDGMF